MNGVTKGGVIVASLHLDKIQMNEFTNALAPSYTSPRSTKDIEALTLVCLVVRSGRKLPKTETIVVNSFVVKYIFINTN